MQKVLITLFWGDAETMRRVTWPAMHVYADQHDYEVQELSWASGTDPAWARVPALRRALDEYDVALWLDADVLVADTEHDVAAELPQDGPWQAFATDGRAGPLTWLWGLRSCPESKDFLDRVWERCEPARAKISGDLDAVQSELRNVAAPALLTWPWVEQYGLLVPGVRFAHAPFNVGTWQQRAAYLASETIVRDPIAPPRRHVDPPPGPYDASAAVSSILMSAGMLDRVLTCGELMAWGEPGASDEMTVWANEGHACIEIQTEEGIRHFGTSSTETGWQTELHDHTGFTPRRWPSEWTTV
jgi:hypothetical protein